MIHIMIFWIITSCILVDGHRHFRGTYCLHFQSRISQVAKVVDYIGGREMSLGAQSG
jgi:hypothetical protein